MVSPAELYSYLIQKGVPPVHALGVVNNIPHESGFRPGVNEVSPIVPGSRGGFGLFQHTGPRREALESFAGDQVSDWRKQVDFALSEPDTQNYLSQDFSDPAEASRWFTTNWLRPQNKERKAEQRLGTLGDFLPLAGIDPRMAGDMTGAPAVSPHTLPDRMTMNTPLDMGPFQQQALQQVMGLLADKRPQPMPMQDMALALGSGILQARPGQNWMAPGAAALMQARQQHQQAQTDQPRVDAYRAQTMLHAMNQFGGGAMSPAERARAIEIQTWQSPDGTQVRTFPYDTATGMYPDGDPPPGWNVTDRAVPVVPGMGGGGTGRPAGVGNVDPEKYTPESLQRFSETGDYSALEWREPPSGGAGGSTAKVEGYKLALNRLMDQVITPLENNPRARAALGTLGKPGAFASGAADIVDFMAGTDLRGRVKEFYGGVDPKIINETIRTSTMPVARLMVDDKGPLSGAEQAQAKALLGQYEKQGFLGPEQGFELLMLTAEALRRQVAAMEGETLPPTTESAPPQDSGLPPGWSVEVTP